MRLDKKIFLKVVNNLLPIALTLWNAFGKKVYLGALPHIQDVRDRLFDPGENLIGYSAKARDVSFDTNVFRFAQQPFNICIFASRCLGKSVQDGIRWSVRWDVKVARKKGWLYGNGYSYLRAENDIGHQIGRIPYVLMPDEVNMSWEEYSKWTKEDDALLKVAEKYKINYSKVSNKSEVLKALDSGLTLFTAMGWYRQMNVPQPTKYYLEQLNGYVGGHAMAYTGYRTYGEDLENLQTFGERYGDKGKAWLRNKSLNYSFTIYVEDSLDEKRKLELVTLYYDKHIVRDAVNPRCYWLEAGKKVYIPTLEQYWLYQARSGTHLFVPTAILDLIPNV